MHLNAGQIACLQGDSGAGKSRLLRAIADLDPNSLDVQWLDKPREAFAVTHWRQAIQYLAAEPVWWTETAGEMISPTWANQAENLGLRPALLSAPIHQLSTGERQRAALLRALSVEPSILLLDEPTAALDQTATAKVETLLRVWCQQNSRAILWVSHDSSQRQRLGLQQWLIKGGALQCL